LVQSEKLGNYPSYFAIIETVNILGTNITWINNNNLTLQK